MLFWCVVVGVLEVGVRGGIALAEFELLWLVVGMRRGDEALVWILERLRRPLETKCCSWGFVP